MKKILLIEEDSDTYYFIDVLFEETRSIIINLSGNFSLSKVVEILPDIILINYHFEDDSGDTLCWKIKKDPRTGHIPVIMYSPIDLKKFSDLSLANAFIKQDKSFNLLPDLVDSFAS